MPGHVPLTPSEIWMPDAAWVGLFTVDERPPDYPAHIDEMPEAPDAPWVEERWHVNEDGMLYQGEKRPHLYSHLADILNEAFRFASEGKGHERHGTAGQPWTDQRHVHIGKEFGTGFALGQAAKKMGESQRMPADRAVRELLGAITYIASAIHLRRSEDDE